MGGDHHLIPKMPDMLNWVTGFRVVVKGWICKIFLKLALKGCFGERGIKDFGSEIFRSVMKLQLRFLDPPLDQLVEDSDVGELLDPPPSLVLLNSHSEMR